MKGCVLAIATAISDPSEPFPPVMITVPVSDLPISLYAFVVFESVEVDPVDLRKGYYKEPLLQLSDRRLESHPEVV